MGNTRPEHLVLLANFSGDQAKPVVAAGFNTDIGSVGTAQPGNSGPIVSFDAPHPLCDYDVYVRNESRGASSAGNQKYVDPLDLTIRPPLIRIAFVGGTGERSLTSAGLPFLKLHPIQDNVSRLETVPQENFAIPAVAQAIADLMSSFLLPIGSYITLSEAPAWPVRHFPVVTNRNGDEIAGYGVVVNGSGSQLLYVVLPQLKNNGAGLVEILRTIISHNPNILPGVRTRDWFSSDRFAFAEERKIDSEIAEKLSEMQAFQEQKRIEQTRVREQFGFIKQILVATEATTLDPSLRLATNVKLVLEFLGFVVEDIDAKKKGAIRKEDFWVRDGEYLAITEVTGTINKNPKSKEYNDILGRMNTIFKRSDLVPELDRSKISGLLVVNYDVEGDPFQRPRLYSGDLEHIAEAAKESGIGILSTVELYKIALAVKEQGLTKELARSMLKEFGRIEYKPKDRSVSDPGLNESKKNG
jgi:hypothetical protein